MSTIPSHVQHHLRSLGVGDAGIATVEREMNKARAMTRDQLKEAVIIKNDAIKLLRIQQAVYLSLLASPDDGQRTT